ncbi:MAG: acetyl-CoA carboxylase biotin carboxylase subunit [Bacteroidetes bacterium]|nr:acetyl-CoA carboxylase biotin carboxylase subunit [Bacteroidota bacterium]MBL6943182.1 acetyl-CoA carboxylase biotin carboxylase subunit [Bacteroidales bacterium]
MKLFKKILIANRGEIAVRIIKSANKLGIRAVAVYSEVDKNSLHVRMADEAYCIGVQELSDTYLNIEKIIDVAKKTNCDGLHPGYGFLAESPLLVEACDNAGITFIGPNTNAITLMGNKIEARKFVKEIGVPMTEGITGNTKTLLKNASSIKFPILVKAAAGGGGKGMRIVYHPEELENVLESTAREALSYFGDGTIYIEKYIEEPRHIEFQVIGDNYGNVIHLFERECTIQRRYQKIIEESPSPTLTAELREKMGESAVNISAKVGYNSVGTIEFLVDKDLNYYFLEMNTRIQVEHPVTEMVTGIDLVEEQILVAAGNKLRLLQKDVSQNGHAIESRIYAEDPANNFIPSPGDITLLDFPEGKNVRIDTSIDKATTIQSFFDPMISKLIVWGEDRPTAINDSITALKNFIIHGIKTNIPYLINVLQHDAFENNCLSTKFCDEHTDEILQTINKTKEKFDKIIPLTALALFTLNINNDKDEKSTWEEIGYWRNVMKLNFIINETEETLELEKVQQNNYYIISNDRSYVATLTSKTENSVVFNIGEQTIKAVVSTDNIGNSFVSIDGFLFNVKRVDILSSGNGLFLSHGDDTGSLFAPMPGKVIKVNVKEGDKVTRGTILLIVEAMKMENNIVAAHDAIVEKIAVREGDMVDTDVQLIILEEILE